MKIYHYTSIDDWERIETRGLEAARRIGRINKEAYNTTALFGLLEPVPKNWTENETFPDIWKHLKRNIGNILLEIEIDENNKNVFVVDRAEIEKFLYKDVFQLSSDEKDIEREVAEGRYMGSKVKLFDYIEKEKDSPYILPEIIITETIPLENVSISEQQPLLKEMFNTDNSEYSKSFARRLEKIPELKQWYEKEYPQPENSEPSLELTKRWK